MTYSQKNIYALKIFAISYMVFYRFEILGFFYLFTFTWSLKNQTKKTQKNPPQQPIAFFHHSPFYAQREPSLVWRIHCEAAKQNLSQLTHWAGDESQTSSSIISNAHGDTVGFVASDRMSSGQICPTGPRVNSL